MTARTLKRVSALALLPLLAACGDLRNDKDPNDGNPKDPASSAFTHEDQGDGSVVTIVDAQDEEAWIYLDLETKKEIAADDAADSSDWDLAFQRYRVRTNGGTSGSGGAAAARLPATFDEIENAPADGWFEDDENGDGVDNDPAYAFHAGDGWYRYDPSTHRLDAREVVYVVRTGAGNHFKIRLLAYYDDAGTPGIVSFRWAPVAGPDDEGDEEEEEPLLDGSCRTKVPSAATALQVTPLCEVPGGTVRHVRIDGMAAGAGHLSAQFLLGFDVAPQNPQAAPADDQFRLMLYGGTPKDVHLAFGSGSTTATATNDFATTPATICFDLVGGSAERAPSLVLWVDGENGADCRDFATLTRATAAAIEEEWGGATGAIASERGAFYRQAAGITATPTVTLFNRSVSSCETVWNENTDWQELCEPLGGATRFRLEDVEASTNNRYFYLVLGEAAEAPTGNPGSEEGDGKAILTGGRAHDGASWTWFRSGGGSSTQFDFATDDEAALYVDGPTTICAEIFGTETSSGLLFWATGANDADCAAHTSLTPDSALHVEEWDAPLATGLRNFIKTSNTDIGLSRVVVSNDRTAAAD